MDLNEAIKARRSIRGFLPKPVPISVLKDVLELAARAPSGVNTQPWEVAVLGGEAMKKVGEAMLEAGRSGVVPEPELNPFPFPEPYFSRQRDVGYRLYEVLGIERSDKVARQAWALRGLNFFDAPNGVVVYLDQCLNDFSLFDVGLFCQTFMLVSTAYGLGTCPEGAAVQYPWILRDILGIPETKKLVCGIAVGYPDMEHPANKLQTPRLPLEEFVQWHGFD